MCTFAYGCPDVTCGVGKLALRARSLSPSLPRSLALSLPRSLAPSHPRNNKLYLTSIEYTNIHSYYVHTYVSVCVRE